MSECLHSYIEPSDIDRLPEWMEVEALVIGTVDMKMDLAVPVLLSASASLVAGVKVGKPGAVQASLMTQGGV